MTFKTLLKIFTRLLTTSLLAIVLINYYIYSTAHPQIHTIADAPIAHTGIVLGAQVYNDGRLSIILQDRAQTAVELYKQGKIQKILVSGDNANINYNELTPTRRWLIAQGIPPADIYLDYAGFNTYNTMYRAQAIFRVHDALVITQAFHLSRAVYLCNALGMRCYGVIADKNEYARASYNEFRELFARVNAFFDILFAVKPKFLGEIIDIHGNPQT